jgi:hypothetical protein
LDTNFKKHHKSKKQWLTTGCVSAAAALLVEAGVAQLVREQYWAK